MTGYESQKSIHVQSADTTITARSERVTHGADEWSLIDRIEADNISTSLVMTSSMNDPNMFRQR